MYKRTAVLLAAVWSVFVISACHRAQDPAQADKDIAAARDKAAEQTQKAEESANSKIGSARSDAQHVAAVQNESVAEADADGAHKIALAACERLGGAEQTSCRDEADADYQVAKARAEQQRVASDPRR